MSDYNNGNRQGLNQKWSFSGQGYEKTQYFFYGLKQGFSGPGGYEIKEYFLGQVLSVREQY